MTPDRYNVWWYGGDAERHTGAPLDLDLDLSGDLIGRRPKAVHGEVLRELTPSDLALLETERGIKPTALARLSERHHALARCLATGLSVADACAITGYTPSRISILKGDPAFEELIAFYQTDKAGLVHDLGDKMRANALEAQAIIADRLEDAPEAFGVDTLLDITKLGADRTGFGPQSRTTSVHVHMNLADRLKAARQRVGAPPAAEGPGMLIEGSLAPTTSERQRRTPVLHKEPSDAEDR